MSKRRKYYDPDPRRKRHSRRGHRKGVEPAGLKRWRLSHTSRGTHDPPRRHFSRARKRVSGYIARHPKARRAGGKLEHGISKYGTLIGAAIAGLWGGWTGYSDYQKAYGPHAGQNYLNTIIGGEIKNSAGTVIDTRTPEISKLWGTNDGLWGAPRGPVEYLKYKVLGLADDDKYKGSAWVYPFWTGIALRLAGPIARIFTHKADRILRPLQKIGTGMIITSTVGALALPGCPKTGDVMPNSQSFPKPPMNPNNNQKIGGAF